MKKQLTSIHIQLSTKELEKLATIVEETLVPGTNPTNSKIFTAADLWNIQRQGKERIQRRNFA